MRTVGSYRSGTAYLTAALVSACLALGLSGCSERILRIDCEKVINTGFQSIGAPLSVDVVSVFPCDLSGDEEEVNELLRFDAGAGTEPITADVWFKRKPTRESMGKEEPNDWDRSLFRIDSGQIISFTDLDKDEVYAKPKNVHGQTLGKKYWPKGQRYYEVKVPIDDIWDDRSVIYVFGRFTDKDGNVLRTKPAVFWKVGDWKRGLEVLVGPDFIKRNIEPTLNKDRDRGGY